MGPSRALKVAVVKHRPQRLAFLALLPLLAIQAFSAQSGAPAPASQTKASEEREGALDMIILLDKSLSMAPFFDQAKAYAAGNLIGSILVPGDRLIVEAVYGKVDRLITTTIATEADKAKAVRAIRAVVANGRFTDLGAALDKAKRDLDELGKPERPKYVVLLSDERQEAPKGSPYQAPDYKLKHPSLEYVKKVDLGKFRAITVGLQVGSKVSETAPVVMQLLLDPPLRAGQAGSSAAGGAGAKGDASGNAPEGGLSRSERALPSWLFYGAAGILALSLAGLVVALLMAGKRKDKSEETKKTA
jgi:Mg-chelatase subunit ChlD